MTVDFPVQLVFDGLFLPACALGSESEVKGYVPIGTGTYRIRLYRANQGVSVERTSARIKHFKLVFLK